MLAALDEQAFMRATVAANVEGAARNGGSAALQVKKETKQTYGNRNEVGLDTVKLASFGLGGR